MKKQSNFVSIGIVSLFLIFSVFCMVILSLLTYSTSKTDLASSKQSFEQTDAYYQVLGTCTDLCIELQALVQDLAADCVDEETLLILLQEAQLPAAVSFERDKSHFSIQIPYSDSQSLSAELAIHFSPDEKQAFLSIQSWNVIQTGQWNPDLHQNVYQK